MNGTEFQRGPGSSEREMGSMNCCSFGRTERVEKVAAIEVVEKRSAKIFMNF